MGGKSVLLSSKETTAGSSVFWCIVVVFGDVSPLLVAVSLLATLLVVVVARMSLRCSCSGLYWFFV